MYHLECMSTSQGIWRIIFSATWQHGREQGARPHLGEQRLSEHSSVFIDRHFIINTPYSTLQTGWKCTCEGKNGASRRGMTTSLPLWRALVKALFEHYNIKSSCQLQEWCGNLWEWNLRKYEQSQISFGRKIALCSVSHHFISECLCESSKWAYNYCSKIKTWQPCTKMYKTVFSFSSD